MVGGMFAGCSAASNGDDAKTSNKKTSYKIGICQLLNNLGSITGGMTSTPALGTLISVAGTEDVASAYAATYPVALISVVVASKLIIMFC